MRKAPPVAPLSGGSASADEWTALRRATTTLPVVSSNPFDDFGIVATDSWLVEKSKDEVVGSVWCTILYHCNATTLGHRLDSLYMAHKRALRPRVTTMCLPGPQPATLPQHSPGLLPDSRGHDHSTRLFVFLIPRKSISFSSSIGSGVRLG